MPHYIHLIDTSILCEVLQIPGKFNPDISKQIIDELTTLSNSPCNKFLLPIATIIETGNHIAKLKNDDRKSELAKKFSELLIKTAESTAPWQYYGFDIKEENLKDIGKNFHQNAVKYGMGTGDLTIICAFEKYKLDKPFEGTIRIWSTDRHLSEYIDIVKMPSKRNRKKIR